MTLLGAASADAAAQRFVAPGGSGVTCSQGAPCSIVTGVNSAGLNDEVIVTPGTYTISAALSTSASGLSIHGQSAQPRPVINTSASNGLLTNGGNLTLRDLTINHTGAGDAIFIVSSGNLIDHVDVHSAGQACLIMGTVRDTLCASSGAGFSGLNFNSSGGTWDLKLRNVTVIGGGTNAPGMDFSAANATTISVDARNVIAQGSGTGKDVQAITSALSATTTVTLQNSNYDSVGTTGAGTETVTAAGTGTNQTAPPLFSDTTDFHQAAGSPTIDAGATDAFTGTTTDLDGEPRIGGAAIDIGADEFTPTVAPAADTTPPETTIDKGPKKKSKSKKATFTFTSSEPGSTFTCTIDKKPAAPCTSPLKLKHLKKGRHKLTVVATDAAGNADATAASYSWKVKKQRHKHHR